MKKQLVWGIVFCTLLSSFLFGGCDSWRRTASSDLPKEVSESVQDKAEVFDDDEEMEENEDLEQEDTFAAHTASIVSRTDETVSWKTSDEMLSQRLYDLLNNKNEIFTENFDEREYDYLSVIIDETGTEQRFYLWINFQRENEIIVEDADGNQWNLSIEDSNQVRSMASTLISG